MGVHHARGPNPRMELRGFATGLVAHHIGAWIDGARRRHGRAGEDAARAAVEQGAGQGTGDVEAEVGVAGEGAHCHPIRQSHAEVGAHSRSTRAVISPGTVPLGVVNAQQSVDRVVDITGRGARPDLAEVAGGGLEAQPGRASSRRRDEVQGAAEHHRAQPVRGVTAKDLDRLGLGGVGETDDIGAVGAIDRQAVAQHQHPALDGVLLQAGSANLDAGLIVSAEEVLHDNARREGEGA